MERNLNRTLVVLGALLCVAALAAVAFAAGDGPVGSAASARAPVGGGNKVGIKSFDYGPVKLEVKAGTKVTWTNSDTAEHTATSDTSGAFDTGAITNGKSKTVTLRKTGTFAYHCDFHPFMHGTVVVR